MTPLATLRIQFNADYTFADAIRDVPDFATLGISHLYASPVWTASPESTHGYDVVDPGTVSETLGGEAGLRQLRDSLKAHGIGLIVDIVPNHMGNGQQNRWWQEICFVGGSKARMRPISISTGMATPTYPLARCYCQCCPNRSRTSCHSASSRSSGGKRTRFACVRRRALAARA